MSHHHLKSIRTNFRPNEEYHLRRGGGGVGEPLSRLLGTEAINLPLRDRLDNQLVNNDSLYMLQILNPKILLGRSASTTCPHFSRLRNLIKVTCERVTWSDFVKFSWASTLLMGLGMFYWWRGRWIFVLKSFLLINMSSLPSRAGKKWEVNLVEGS